MSKNIILGMLRRMLGIKNIGNITKEEIRARACVANISATITEAILRWLGHVDNYNEEDVVMRTWKTEVGGYRNIGRQMVE